MNSPTTPLSSPTLTIPNIFTLIGIAWSFYRKQPVLNSVLLWLMVLPLAIITILGDIIKRHPLFRDIAENGIIWGETDIRPLILITVIQLAFSIVIIWGIACILLVGKKLTANKAGRTRTSFRIVHRQGRKFVLNLFITGILRDCFTILWGLLLIVPGIIYAIRTAFYHIAIVIEGLEYRASLKRSKEVVMGHTWKAFWYLLGLSIVLFLPIMAIAAILNGVGIFDPRLFPAIFLLNSVIFSIALLLFILTTILLYGELLKLPRPVEVKPDATQKA